MDKNNILYNQDGTKRIQDNALVSLTLMNAVSKAIEKETMVKVIISLIKKITYKYWIKKLFNYLILIKKHYF